MSNPSTEQNIPWYIRLRFSLSRRIAKNGKGAEVKEVKIKLVKALDNLDEYIANIKKSKTNGTTK